MKGNFTNNVFYPGSDTPLILSQLAMEVDNVIPEDEVAESITGQLCNCPHGGDFELFPRDHPDVVAGGKRYMWCRKCGEVSHL